MCDVRHQYGYQCGFYFATVFGCKVGVPLTQYLGLPLCLGMPMKTLWNPVIARCKKKLSSGKGKYLSFGGCITMLKSVLASLPIYFVSCFKFQMNVIRLNEKIQQFCGTTCLIKRNIIW